MNDIKLLALDLDGTALKSNNSLSTVVKKAIKRASENGMADLTVLCPIIY